MYIFLAKNHYGCFAKYFENFWNQRICFLGPRKRVLGKYIICQTCEKKQSLSFNGRSRASSVFAFISFPLFLFFPFIYLSFPLFLYLSFFLFFPFISFLSLYFFSFPLFIYLFLYFIIFPFISFLSLYFFSFPLFLFFPFIYLSFPLFLYLYLYFIIFPFIYFLSLYLFIFSFISLSFPLLFNAFRVTIKHFLRETSSQVWLCIYVYCFM